MPSQKTIAPKSPVAFNPRALLGLALTVPLLANGIAAQSHAQDASTLVRSILSNRCFACHGPDDEQRQGGFRLDERQSYLAEADSGERPIVAGAPEESELMRRILSRDEYEQMPPPEFGAPLSDEEIELIRNWIHLGAPLPQHWSFTPPERPALPSLHNIPSAWQRSAVDRFVASRHSSVGLSPSPRASRSELLRRVSLDLIGLPPTTEELHHFQQNPSPFAYEEEVDRLLASPQFGEHWARKWLDLARYADSAGYADDPARTIWAYRDWVIRSINSNLSIDAFTIHQLAGDLLDTPSQEQLIATAFHRNTLTNNEGGTNDEEFRNVAVIDRVNTTMAVWMGLTMNCAQCHNHKYDPFTQEEYFQLFAIFNQTQDEDKRDERPTLPVFTQQQELQKKQWLKRHEELQAKVQLLTPQMEREFQAWTSELHAPQWAAASPTSASAKASSLKVDPLGVVRVVGPSPEKDTYTLSVPIAEGTRISALRLAVLTDSELPNSGPGLANGNFVLTEFSAALVPHQQQSPQVRQVRIEHPGKDKILSLAEVQVFSEGQNVASTGEVSQSSTTHAGIAKLAIDGNTNGDFFEAKSTTHTATSANPWWQLDLGQTTPVEKIVIWNRSDHELQARLVGARLMLLDEQGAILFSQTISDQRDSYSITPTTVKQLTFTRATADYSQQDFPATHAIDGNASTGWAIGGKQGEAHSLTLELDSPIRIETPSELKIELEQNSQFSKHQIGKFQLLSSDSDQVAMWMQLDEDLREIQRTPIEQRSESQNQKLRRFFARRACRANAKLRAELDKLEQRLDALTPETTVPILRELDRDNRRKTFVQIRGNYKSLGNEVHAGTPSVFPPVKSPSQTVDRLDLARWLVSRDNPLTARVWMNRWWESLFGIGLVRTSEEFGSQGDLPSHPELLDWLAVEFMESGWDRKAMLRMLVTSETYQQTSQVSAEALAKDKDNIFLARGPRVRLTAEMVRDQSLAIGGLLSAEMFGPPVRPPQPDLGLKAAFGSATDWKTSQGADRYRRGIYTLWRRSSPYPSMATFDAPSREVCTLRRDRTNTPLQALVTLNDPSFVEAAQALARRVVVKELPSASVEARLDQIFRLATNRSPSQLERQPLVSLLQEARQLFEEDSQAAEQLATDPLGPLPSGADPIELAAYTCVCNVILNLDEVLMKR